MSAVSPKPLPRIPRRLGSGADGCSTTWRTSSTSSSIPHRSPSHSTGRGWSCSSRAAPSKADATAAGELPSTRSRSQTCGLTCGDHRMEAAGAMALGRPGRTGLGLVEADRRDRQRSTARRRAGVPRRHLPAQGRLAQTVPLQRRPRRRPRLARSDRAGLPFRSRTRWTRSVKGQSSFISPSVSRTSAPGSTSATVVSAISRSGGTSSATAAACRSSAPWNTSISEGLGTFPPALGLS